jgi:hypothetical protein
MHSIFDPHHPMRHRIDMIDQTMSTDDSTAGEIAAGLPQPFSKMYHEFRRFSEQSLCAPRMKDFLSYIRGLDTAVPTKSDLDEAPELCRWALVRRPVSSFCQLVGYAVGHPRFEHGPPLVTSTVFRIDVELKWARTLIRFFLLNENDIESVGRMKADGMISHDAELVDLG